MSHERIDLCGLWRFQPDSSREGEKAGYFHPEHDPRHWREVLLPNDFEACSPNLDTYEGEGWFRRTVTVPAGWQGKRVVLRFEGVNYHAKVWVNGQEVGEHHDGFLPFQFPIQALLYFGDKNVITVRADNFRREGEVPGIQRGWRTFGGILREVELVATDLLYLDHITITAEPSEEGGELAIRAKIRNERAQAVNAELLVQIMDSEGKELAIFTSQPVMLQTDAETVFSLRGQVEDVKPWSPAEPNLYKAKVELPPAYVQERTVFGSDSGGIQVEHAAGLFKQYSDALRKTSWQHVLQKLSAPEPAYAGVVDEKTIRFGFRKIQTQNGRLLLNGRPIYLTGFNRHEDSPRRNMATDLETARRDLIDMKEAGANFVRLCHYPHHPGEIDLCDELGLLVMNEIPLYWWNGYQEGETNCANKLEAAKRQLKAMIQRDINHPSVIFWSVSNETEEDRPEVADGNRQLISLAKELDTTRLAVHVSDRWKQNPHFDEDDVICVNDYPSLNRRGYSGQSDYDLSESTGYWRENLRKLHEQYPHKPILISEFGYASFEGFHDNGFSEDLQAQAIQMEFAGMDASYICGATIWCWADHPWPQATFAFCRHIGLSPYGVVTRERRRLRAYWTARRLFREKQGLLEQPRGASSGSGVNMIRPNLLNIPQVPFPEGFGIRPMRLDDVGLWTDIQRDAEQYVEISDELFRQQFGHDLQAIQWRSFIITNSKGVGVGTISAWYDCDFRGEDYGRIHWLAVRPAYQRKGLGKAALSFALNKLAQWHDRCFLDTSIERLPAIKLYLDFGFMPDLDPPGHIERWRKVKDELKHPLLENVLP